jgi:hypothetical protein
MNNKITGAALGTGVLAQGVTGHSHVGIDHAYDAHTYTINNTANQTLNAVQIGAQRQNHNIVFHGPSGKEVGRFDFNGDEMKFDGQADVSAAIFIEWARKSFNDRALEDKRSVLKEVMDALLHESTGALYEDAEKLAILTCIQRVREIQQSVEPAQAEMDYSTNLAKSMVATKNAVASSIIGSVFGGQP